MSQIVHLLSKCWTTCMYVTEEIPHLDHDNDDDNDHPDKKHVDNEEQQMMNHLASSSVSSLVEAEEEEEEDVHRNAELEDYSHFDGHTSSPPPVVPLLQQKLVSSTLSTVTNHEEQGRMDTIELNPLAIELSPAEYEKQWANSSISSYRCYALLLNKNDDESFGDESRFEQMNHIENLFVKYNIYTLASDSAAVLSDDRLRQMKRRVYMFAERNFNRGDESRQLYLIELVIDMNNSQIQVRVKTTHDSTNSASSSIHDFMRLIDRILSSVSTPKLEDEKQTTSKKKRRRNRN